MGGRTKLILAVVSVVVIVAAIVIIATRKSEIALSSVVAVEKKDIIDTSSNEVISSTRGYVESNTNDKGMIKNPNTGSYTCTEVSYCTNCKKAISILAETCPFCNSVANANRRPESPSVSKAGKAKGGKGNKGGDTE